MPTDLELEPFLSHYGVKGMKWGERKQLEAQAKTAYDQFAQVGADRIEYTHRAITKQEYDSLSSKPIKLGDSGEEFKRLVATNSPVLRGDLAYVTKDGQDHTNYLALFSPEGNRANVNKYSATVKVSSQVISPGMKVRVDTFIKTLGDAVVDSNSGEVIKGRAYVTGYLKRTDEPNDLKKLSNKQLGLTYYQRFTQGQHVNDSLNQTYIKNIKRQGYNALIDDADKGMLSKTPIILFTKETGARVVEVKRITSDDELIARANILAPEQLNQ